MAHSSPLHFTIYAPPFNEYVGGIVVLYQLAWILNRLGWRAVIWPQMRPSLARVNSLSVLTELLKYPYRHWRYAASYESPYSLDLTRRWLPADSIVVYPEIVSGNPLAARRVCRWLLNAPGAVKGNAIRPAKDDLFFHYHDVYLPSDEIYRDSTELRVVIPNPIYRQTNYGERRGICYLLRKGRDRIDHSHPPDAILVDPLSHAEKARIFNQCELFLSYDDRTMYSAYAAMCGCRSVVIPRPGVAIDEWDPSGTARLGVAYGLVDQQRGLESVPQLFHLLEKWTEESSESVAKFVVRCQKHFG